MFRVIPAIEYVATCDRCGAERRVPLSGPPGSTKEIRSFGEAGWRHAQAETGRIYLCPTCFGGVLSVPDVS